MKKIGVYLFCFLVALTFSSCTTVSARNLNNATRASADASFAFEAAVENFSVAVAGFRRAVILFEFAVEDFASENDSELILEYRDLTFYASRMAAIMQRDAQASYEASQEAYNVSIQTGTDFRRASQDIIIASDPWENNQRIRRNAIAAQNISVDIHNRALIRRESLEDDFIALQRIYIGLIESHTAILQKHDIASLPEEFLFMWAILTEAAGMDFAEAYEMVLGFADDHVRNNQDSAMRRNP
jgi:hypothetical protein